MQPAGQDDFTDEIAGLIDGKLSSCEPNRVVGRNAVTAYADGSRATERNILRDGTALAVSDPQCDFSLLCELNVLNYINF